MISNGDGINEVRYDTKENWELYNPILEKGELAVEVVGNTYNLKCGNGTTAWNDLKYISFSETSEGGNYFDNGYIQLNSDGSASFAGKKVSISNVGVLTLLNTANVKDINGVTIEKENDRILIGGVDITNISQGKDGKSAYEIWLDLGNRGSEQDFINSLKGEDGSIFSFQIEEGNLMMYYADGTEPPNFSINEYGELILTLE